MVVSSPATPAGRPRSSRMNGNSGPIARICGRMASDARKRPAMTPTGMTALEGAADRASAVTGSDTGPL